MARNDRTHTLPKAMHTVAQVACFGEMLLRLSAGHGERLLQSPRFHAAFAGAEANVACALARFGHDTTMLSALPLNPLGRQCAAYLHSFGVKTGDILWSPGRMGLFYLEPGAPGRPANVTYDRSDSTFARQDFLLDWRRILAGRDWLHMSGISMALGNGPKRAVTEAAMHARDLGLRISIDCNHRPSLWRGRSTEAAQCQRALIENAMVLFANDRDVALATERTPHGATAGEKFRWAFELAREIAPRLSVMASTHRSLDESGTESLHAFACDAHGMHVAGPIRLGPAVDRVGTGDAFAAGFLHRYMVDGDIVRALEFGLAAAVYKRSLNGDVLRASAEDIEAAAESASDILR